jgi:hypothetical protein
MENEKKHEGLESQEIDVELFAKEGKEVPKGRVYIITVDRQKLR